MAENYSKRTFGSLWNETLVAGTVLGVEIDTYGKRANIFLNVRWDLPGEQRVKLIISRNATAGGPPSIELAALCQEQTSPVAFAGFQDYQDGGNRQLAQAAYSSTPPAPTPAPDPSLDNFMSWNAHGVEWKQRDVRQPVGGGLLFVACGRWTVGGESIVEGGDSGTLAPRSRPFDYFMAAFPQSHIVHMVQLTSKALQEQ
jgi:hypothetical protein